jgi:hypothetical protein
MGVGKQVLGIAGQTMVCLGGFWRGEGSRLPPVPRRVAMVTALGIGSGDSQTRVERSLSQPIGS